MATAHVTRVQTGTDQKLRYDTAQEASERLSNILRVHGYPDDTADRLRAGERIVHCGHVYWVSG